VKFFTKNNSWNDEDFHWDIVEISKVNSNIINQLVSNILDLEIGDNFFISFESLLKLGTKAQPAIAKRLKKVNGTKSIKKLLLTYLSNRNSQSDDAFPLVKRLYHPDFLIRATTISRLSLHESKKYIDYILPLLEDPDDSIRWAVIKFLVKNRPIPLGEIKKIFQEHFEVESNQRIKDKILKRMEEI